MMRVLSMLILCLCTLTIHGQTKKNRNSGEMYVFEKATFTIYNYNSKAVVDTRVITDPATLNAEDMFFQNVFRKVIISDGALIFCTLPDQKDYMVKSDGLKLFPAKTLVIPKGQQVDPNINNLPNQLEPYSLTVNNDVVTFSVDYLYGNSKYNFPLEGKLTLTMIKQK